MQSEKRKLEKSFFLQSTTQSERKICIVTIKIIVQIFYGDTILNKILESFKFFDQNWCTKF